MDAQPSTLNASVPLALGVHRIVVQSISSTNKISKAVTYVTIQNPAPPPPPPPPTTTYSNLQESTNWQTCGNCGNGGATGKLATYTMERGITSPAVDNTSTSAQFSIGGPNPYTNAYWYIKNTAPKAPLKSLVYDFYLYVPEASVKSPQGIEFECQHTVNGYTYNYAWQADYASKTWRTFDFINRAWVNTVIPFTGLTPGTWHHIIAEYHANANNTVHDALTVDGVRTVVNITRPAKHTGQTYASFTNAFQLDLNKTPVPFDVYVDQMNVTFQ